jgi:carbon monoxide dehydrogenase subunit G
VKKLILEGSREVSAPLDKVWDFLVDLNKVTKCIPDTTVESIEGDSFKAKMKVGVGFIRGTFDGTFSLTDKKPKSEVTIKGSAKGMGNNLNLSVRIMLEPIDTNKVQLKWSADVLLAGMLASVGQRYIKDTADKIVNQMFECLSQSLSS